MTLLLLWLWAVGALDAEPAYLRPPPLAGADEPRPLVVAAGDRTHAAAPSEMRAPVRPPVEDGPVGDEGWAVELAIAEPVARWVRAEADGEGRGFALMACGREVVSFRAGGGVVLPHKAYVHGFETREAALDVVERLASAGGC